MKIPKKLKVGGHIYEIKHTTGLADSGSVDFTRHLIHINNGMCKQEQESVLIHECLEVINYNNDLNLTHQTIQTLEANIYQIIRDNKLI